MSVNETILNQTFNRFGIVGSVHEMGMLEKQSDGKWKQVPMKITTVEREKWENGKPTGVMFKCERLRGTITLKTDKGLQSVSICFYSKNADGSDNKRWSMAQKIMDWNPTIGGNGEEPSYVSMNGRVSIYDNVSTKDGKLYSNLQWNADSKCQHVDVDVKSGCSLMAVCFLKSFRPETRGSSDDAEETGRLIVELYGADNRGQCFPITCIVEEDLADDFESCFEVGQTLDCEFNRVMRHYGGSTTGKKKTFGKSADISINTGYDVEELILTGADIVEEPDELEDEDGNEIKTKWINPNAMKMALKERKKMLEEKLNDNKSDNSTKAHNSLKEKKQAAKSVGKKTQTTAPWDDDEDDPF